MEMYISFAITLLLKWPIFSARELADFKLEWPGRSNEFDDG
jgi:hypothetical protein